MLNYEELINLRKPKKITKEINISSLIFILISLFCFISTEFTFIIIGLLFFLIGLSGTLDHYYISGMYGDSRLSFLLNEYRKEFLILIDKNTKFNFKENEFELNIENYLFQISYKNKEIYIFNFQDNTLIFNNTNTSISIPLLKFINNAQFNLIKK